MRLLLGSLFAFAAAALIGLGATWLVLNEGVAYGGITIGAWTAWPKNGTPGIDPYARAMVARSGELPVGSGDGVSFYARADDAARPLDGRCDVVLSGTTPQARFWTLTLYDPEGKLVANSVRAPRLHQPGDHPQRERDLRDRDRPARAARQLAADRGHRALRAGAAAL